MNYRHSPFWLSLTAGACVTVIMIAPILGWARQRSEDPAKSAARVVGPASEEVTEQRLREGSTLETVGVFRVTGDRITFYPKDSSTSYRALENLALERIAKMVGETRGEREWIVSGTVTEYRGGNYLLVGRCLVKSQQK